MNETEKTIAAPESAEATPIKLSIVLKHADNQWHGICPELRIASTHSTKAAAWCRIARAISESLFHAITRGSAESELFTDDTMDEEGPSSTAQSMSIQIATSERRWVVRADTTTFAGELDLEPCDTTPDPFTEALKHLARESGVVRATGGQILSTLNHRHTGHRDRTWPRNNGEAQERIYFAIPRLRENGFVVNIRNSPNSKHSRFCIRFLQSDDATSHNGGPSQ